METNQTKVETIDELPELPFQRILSYLSLGDRLRSRAVSRGWYERIKIDKVKSLCCSNHSSGFIWQKSRWVRGIFVQNFVSSPRIDRFFATHASTILSDLNHLRLCDLRLNDENMSVFFQALNSFGELEELDIIRFGRHPSPNPKVDFNLNLPMLRSIHLEYVDAVERLILDSPRLEKVKLVENEASPSLVLVHGESVEKLLIDGAERIEWKNLKNLQYLYIANCSEVDSRLLSHLEQLKELHLNDHALSAISQLFEQKQQYDRTDLKIYRFGCLLDGPEDPSISRFNDFYANELLVHLAENPTRLAAEIPLCRSLPYGEIERVHPELAVSLLKKFTDLNRLVVDEPIQDIGRFLHLLKTFDNIARLWFDCDQPQDLFDRLPEHCAVQRLVIVGAPSDLRFLFSLQHLVNLSLEFSTHQNEFIRKILQLPFLLKFEFLYMNRRVQIQIDHPSSIYPKRFQVSVDGNAKHFSDPNSAIEFIAANATDRRQ